MSEFLKFPSIDQFRNVVKRVRDISQHDNTPLPVVDFFGTVKLHGTNAAVGYDASTGEIWAQSRTSIITPEKDNFGFARFVKENEEYFRSVFTKNNRYDGNIIHLFGEWCGPGVQKGVGISDIDRKIFVAFDMVIDGERHWSVPCFYADQLPFGQRRVFSIIECGTFEVQIDFSNPKSIQNHLVELTTKVEEECPFAKLFGVSGIGEGIVWETYLHPSLEPMRFKVKGEKHSISKVKTLAEVDPEKVASIAAFVEKVVTENRLEQGVREVFGDADVDVKNMGAFIKWVVGDVLKEESDVMEVSGISQKEVGKCVAPAARQWLLGRI